MMALGHDGLLSRVEVEHVVDYVRSLSDASQRISPPAPSVGAGQTIFAENCAACHGENGQGKTEMGAPNLADTTWIYGGDLQSVFTTVWGGRRGIMPTWEDRLSPIERKILALYLVDLRASRP
jgi:cytochrome c oxidase cbb3-type subunit 3